MRMFAFVSLILTAVASGCSRTEEAPRLAGGREVSSWVTDLNDPKPQARRLAVLKLGNVGDADVTAAEGLARALHDADVLVRGDAVHAVVKLKQPSDVILARLREMSHSDPDEKVRDFAARALKKLGVNQ
jgi:HEAT repeat protein